MKRLLLLISRRKDQTIFGIVCLFLFLGSCKKVDEHVTLVENQPWIFTGGTYLPGIGEYTFNTSFLVGDTVTIAGNLFLDRAGSSIQVGNTKAQYIDTESFTATNGQKLNYVRFLITPDMGTGSNIPVIVSANGVQIAAPDFTIRQFQGIQQRTDTTLYVDSIAQWTPQDASLYNPYSAPDIIRSSVSRDGDIYFHNYLGIWSIKNGEVSQVLQSGVSSFAAGDTTFTIKTVVGSVISLDGLTLNFSAEVVENNQDTVNNYIYRLCAMDVASGKVTTLNRTLVTKGLATDNEDPGPAEGSVINLHIVATNLRTDLNNKLYFTNIYTPPDSRYNHTSIWYNTYLKGGRMITGQYIMSNFCSINTDGNVHSLFQYKPIYGVGPIYTLPGYQIANTYDVKIDQQGTTAYAIDNQNILQFSSIMKYDISEQIPLISTGTTTKFRFFSYDTSSVTGNSVWLYVTTNLRPSNNELPYMLPLPNGNLLIKMTGSLLAADMLNVTAYCYAGTEKGLGSPPSVQNQTTGPAKYVNFSNVNFVGIDKNDVIYYYIGGGSGAVKFYKMYPKGE